MKKLLIFFLLLIGCKDDGPKCFICDVEINNKDKFEEKYCGSSTAFGMERKLKKGDIYGNTVINGQTWKVTKANCKILK
jgi:hypothetical protein